MTIRAVLYARYSTDLQRQTSIDDQLRAARARAESEGWVIVATHADEGVSGSTPVALRRGGKALLADALAARFDVLVLEGLDRLSREIGEAEMMVKRLEHRGIRIIGTSDGYDTEAKGRKVMRIARGLVNELYLDDLREKTHRGLAGQFDRGFSAGGRTYGYRTQDAGSGRRLIVDEAEASIVREIFESFAAGDSVQTIVHHLNQRGVRSARDSTWAVSALRGSSKHGLGVLNNELYRGRLVWNRRQWLKDPETGKRRYVERPRAEWLERDEPTLRIIGDELWDAAHARFATRDTSRGGPRQRTLFGGLLRCEACGGPFIAINSTRYGCNANKDRGATVCSNTATISRHVADQRLLTEVRNEMAGPVELHEMAGYLTEALREQQRGAASGTEEARRRQADLDAEIGRLVDAIARVGFSTALGERLHAAEVERSRLRAQIDRDMPRDVAGVVDEALATYRQTLLHLQSALGADELERTRKLLAEIMGPIVIERREDGSTWARIEKTAERLLVQAVSGSSISVVAGACNSSWRFIQLS